MRAPLPLFGAAIALCVATTAHADITILKEDGSPVTPSDATVTFNPKTGGWTIVLHALYNVGGWSRYDIRGNGGEVIDRLQIDVPVLGSARWQLHPGVARRSSWTSSATGRSASRPCTRSCRRAPRRRS